MTFVTRLLYVNQWEMLVTFCEIFVNLAETTDKSFQNFREIKNNNFENTFGEIL